MTYIIAEIGVNHNNDLGIAKKIIDFCAREKVDAVKFQTFKAENLALKNTKKVKYQLKQKKDKENHFQMLKKLELSEKDHKYLINYCKKKKIDFISTPYDIESAKFLISQKVKTIKVSSADLTDRFLHEYLSKTDKNIIISTGMSNINEIKSTLKIYKNNKSKISLLHCVSNYPSSYSSLNLDCLSSLKKLNCKIGFSDHTIDALAAVVAVSKGAQIIEKHITLDNNLPGPDHKASLNLKNFKIFLEQLRKTKLIIGKNVKKVQPEEKEMMAISRKGLYYNKSISKGKLIKKTDLISLRPNTKFKVFNYKSIINKKLIKKVFKNKPVQMTHFKK